MLNLLLTTKKAGAVDAEALLLNSTPFAGDWGGRAAIHVSCAAKPRRGGFVEKGLRPLQPVCSGAFPPASPPCHHYGQGCRSFLPKICAPRYARVGTKGLYGGTAHNFGTENLRPRYRMVARKFSCKISKKQLAAFDIDLFNKPRRGHPPSLACPDCWPSLVVATPPASSGSFLCLIFFVTN